MNRSVREGSSAVPPEITTIGHRAVRGDKMSLNEHVKSEHVLCWAYVIGRLCVVPGAVTLTASLSQWNSSGVALMSLIMSLGNEVQQLRAARLPVTIDRVLVRGGQSGADFCVCLIQRKPIERNMMRGSEPLGKVEALVTSA